MRSLAIGLFALLAACGGGHDEGPGLDSCGPNGECPAGYLCNPVNNRCYLRSTTMPDARGPDAPPSDDTPPDTTITGKPSAISGPSVTFLFEASEPATFECRLDGADFAACASPLTLSGLTATPDPHVFAVRARDLAGNIDDTPASYSWTVDPNTLDTSIVQAPPATSGPDVTFSFSSTRPGTFECRLRPTDAEFAPCVSPKPYSGLTGDGTTQPYTFEVRGVDIAGARDDSPAVYIWYVDTTPPVVHIVAPTGTTNGRPTIQLTVEPGAAYTCAIDGGAPFACGASTPVPADLGDGPHTLVARGVDALGNGAQDSGTWTVDATPPTITLTGPSNGATTGKQVTFTYTVSDGTSSCQLDGAAPPGGCGSPVALSFSTSGAHTFAVTAVDAVGNSRTVQRAWTVDADPPTIALIGPSNGVRTTGQNIVFLSSVSDGTRSCALGPAGGALGPVACDAVHTLAGGDWTYQVTAVDGFANQRQVSRTWTVSATATPLNVVLLSPLPGVKQGNPVWVAFTLGASFSNGPVNPASFQFECMIDWKNPVACYPGAAGVAFANVPVGQHTVSVRATVGTESIVQDGYFEVSASPPAFTVTAPVRGSTVSAPLVIDHNGGNIQCALDEQAPMSCPPGGTAMYPSFGPNEVLFLLAGGHSYGQTFLRANNCGRLTDADTVAQWPMEGTQRIDDTSGNGRHAFLGTNGTIEANDPTYTFGHVGSAVSFDDASARVTATTAAHSFPDGMTIEAWVNVPFSGRPSGTIIAPTLVSGQQRRLVLELLADGEIQASIEGTTAQVKGFPVFDCWGHVMATYDAVTGTLHLYLDRYAVLTASAPPGTALGTVNGYTFGPFTGPGISIDDVRISRRARTSAELPFSGCIACTTP